MRIKPMKIADAAMAGERPSDELQDREKAAARELAEVREALGAGDGRVDERQVTTLSVGVLRVAPLR